MSDAPNSYKDPYWTDLAASTETKLGLPNGLLAAIVTKGERSNHDQVSEAGAKTVFQITPSARKAAIDKYGVDPYLSPENAAEVAGMFLKDSLQRNKGDVSAAVAEYHGGTDRANWGPRTRSYVARVLGDQQINQPTSGSTFQRALAAQQPAASGIASVYRAYQAGKMSPQEAAEFEADVKSGLVVLPKGAVLNGQQTQSPTAKPDAVVLPQAVTDAYVSGRMSAQDRTDLENDIKAGLVKLPPTASELVPEGEGWTPPTEHITADQLNARPKPPTLGEQLIGAGEAGLTTLTGATGGTIGALGGTAKQLAQNVLDGTFGTPQAADLVAQSAAEGAQALTYAPRTEQGREQAQAVGNFFQQTIPIVPLTAEVGLLGQAAKSAAPVVAARTAAKVGQVVDAVKPPVVNAVNAVKSAPGRAIEAIGLKSPEVAAPTSDVGGSVGSMSVDAATVRRIASSELPVPVELTKGQATRDFGQLRFEQESAKNPELGAPIRERIEQQHRAVRQSFDAWIDETGAQTPDNRSAGIAVDKALTAKAARDKAEIRVAYKEAEKAGELQEPVSTQQVVDVLNTSRSAESTAPVLTAAKKELIRLGGAIEGTDGQLIAKDTSLGATEQLRKFVNKVTGYDPTNIKFASDIKRAIDTSTEGAGGKLYAKARNLRAKYADQYENRAIISDLLSNKRGTNDRRVALEDVTDRILFRSSLDDVRFARKVLQTGGEEGKQAWREIQGSALRYIRDEATKGITRDSSGNEVISASSLDRAIRRLDNDGKLDYLFGKQGAEKLRAVNDLAKVMFTAPPGAVNTSNTASVLLAALDLAISGSAGVPLPIASGLRLILKNVKDRKLRARIQDALDKK